MRVSKWGNSLAVRIPIAVAEAVDLKEGDEVELKPSGSASFEVVRKRDRQEILKELHKFHGLLPADFKFDREEANAR
ncbi:MAG: AbrB/MazE/SpoVT family DNA-binding domain-containing protein [Mesorhizobium sp.]|nr:AbrB/MazE/SpoVT family DNA-binding domain-containing protein [Mesorhizobium sp.]MCO5160411.1 AbrB/MazE/SpoVT family DNA-binding domain-containing protein [Mesorhizobium sp.]